MEILYPPDGAVLDGHDLPTFSAVVDDFEDDPRVLALAWSSSVQRVDATEPADASGIASWLPESLAEGVHIISLTATDPRDNIGSDRIQITIELDPWGGDTPGIDTDVEPTPEPTSTPEPTPQPTPNPTPVPTPGDIPDTDPPDTDVPDTDPPDTDVPDTDSPIVVPPPSCSLPPLYDRILHTMGDVDFIDVEWAPDGSYALILGRPAALYRWDPTPGTLNVVAQANESWYDIEFSPDGSYALVGGGDAISGPAPVLHRYTPSQGLVSVPNITGPSTGRLLAGYQIRSMAFHPTTMQLAILGDDDHGFSNGTACLNLMDPDFATDAHTWSAEGCLNISQGASSIAWGENLGQPIALGASRYLELLYYNAALPTNQFQVQPTPNTGNLKRVRFNPADPAQAWVLNWSGSGKVYSWEGVLRNDPANSFGFSAWSMWDFGVSSDGAWKLFVGRNGNAWFSDSPWRPVDHGRFYNHPIPAWDQPPWSGSSNDYLQAVAWRPGTCEGLVVGDATQGQGTLAWFTLQ